MIGRHGYIFSLQKNTHNSGQLRGSWGFQLRVVKLQCVVKLDRKAAVESCFAAVEARLANNASLYVPGLVWNDASITDDDGAKASRARLRRVLSLLRTRKAARGTKTNVSGSLEALIEVLERVLRRQGCAHGFAGAGVGPLLLQPWPTGCA